ncbi:hypothetical protein UNDKW_0678 [Undibacterium sp. KW1]|uniref:hypothetical protein n=1 Tax=Undibacterium sp. KW1 TaxID=2058624 RepID=UPI001331F25C|nr:hypothetical protein [Undibacterium sp. KW1]BBB58951.1 hypothetical protein UNDKW_0678 [Undibacterium sp. KW1]
MWSTICGVVIFVIVLKIVINEINRRARKKFDSLSPDEQAIELQKQYEAKQHYLYGSINEKLVCQHCQVQGKIRVKRVVISNESLTGNIVKVKTVHKADATQMHCENCRVTWNV